MPEFHQSFVIVEQLQLRTMFQAEQLQAKNNLPNRSTKPPMDFRPPVLAIFRALVQSAGS